MECIMVLLGEKTDWDTVKRVLGNVGEFMNKLLEYNVEETTEKTWKKARDGWISFFEVFLRRDCIALANA